MCITFSNYTVSLKSLIITIILSSPLTYTSTFLIRITRFYPSSSASGTMRNIYDSSFGLSIANTYDSEYELAAKSSVHIYECSREEEFKIDAAAAVGA